MRKPPPSRLEGFDYCGQYGYSLRFCVNHRQKVFTDAHPVSLVWAQILRAAQQERFAVIAYCFMPDHLHLVVEGMDDGSDLKRFFVNAKRYSAIRFRDEYGTRLWQPKGYERVLRAAEHLHVVVRYVLENPVRAGLVDDPRDYPFLGSAVYGLDELVEWSMPRRRR